MNNIKEKIKAVIFDFDDTLVRSKEESVRRHRLAAEKENMHFDEKEFLQKYGGPWPDIIYELYGKDAARFIKTFMSMGDFSGKKVDGADEIVRDIASRNILLGIISSGPKEIFTKRMKKELDCADLFDKEMIAGREDVKIHKPHKEAFSKISSYLKSKNINNENILYCGDLLIDYEFSRNIDVRFIAVTTGIHKKEMFIRKGLKEDNIITSVKGLPEKMSELGMI